MRSPRRFALFVPAFLLFVVTFNGTNGGALAQESESTSPTTATAEPSDSATGGENSTHSHASHTHAMEGETSGDGQTENESAAAHAHEPTGQDLGPLLEAGCIDENGIWTVPRGLVLGGPEDNTETEPYRTWMAACQLGLTGYQITDYTPLARLQESWDECLGDVDEAARYVQEHNESSGHDFGPEGLHHQTCGRNPAELESLENGTVPLGRDIFHVGRPGESIHMGRRIYADKEGTEPSDPVNAVFYGAGGDEEVAGFLTGITPVGWKTTSHHSFTWGCDTPKWAYIVNEPHGGTDGLFRTSITLEHDHDWSCSTDRIHGRTYPTVPDNHVPSFGSWTPFPHHYDEEGSHNALFSEEDAGDHLIGEIEDSPLVQTMWKATYSCSGCPSDYNGYVWFIRLVQPDGGGLSPEEGDGVNPSETGDGGPTDNLPDAHLCNDTTDFVCDAGEFEDGLILLCDSNSDGFWTPTECVDATGPIVGIILGVVAEGTDLACSVLDTDDTGDCVPGIPGECDPPLDETPVLCEPPPPPPPCPPPTNGEFPVCTVEPPPPPPCPPPTSGEFPICTVETPPPPPCPIFTTGEFPVCMPEDVQVCDIEPSLCNPPPDPLAVVCQIVFNDPSCILAPTSDAESSMNDNSTALQDQDSNADATSSDNAGESEGSQGTPAANSTQHEDDPSAGNANNDTTTPQEAEQSGTANATSPGDNTSPASNETSSEPAGANGTTQPEEAEPTSNADESSSAKTTSDTSAPGDQEASGSGEPESTETAQEGSTAGSSEASPSGETTDP